MFKVIKKVDNLLAFSWKYSSVVVSFFLWMSSAFFLRDELNFPTYLKIKQAYLVHRARMMEEPNHDILKIIDPNLIEQTEMKIGMKVRKSQKTYDELVEEKQQQIDFDQIKQLQAPPNYQSPDSNQADSDRDR